MSFRFDFSDEGFENNENQDAAASGPGTLEEAGTPGYVQPRAWDLKALVGKPEGSSL